ncbi:MAG: tRNA (guanosine(37)-N1)-methyltransferase TrmD [Candidatus Tagabacteria bacterium]
MTTFYIFTIFPESFKSYFNTSILKRAQKKKIIKIKIYNIRDFAKDKYKSVDDRPYGGGPGMVMKIEPIVKAVISIKSKSLPRRQAGKIILFSARGQQFNQKMAREWAKKNKDIVLICGHYEGIDERVKKILKACLPAGRAEEISIGPYVLSGGEAGAMVLVDAISRHLPGVLGKIESLEEKKGSYPVYTRPEIFECKKKRYVVPRILLSGDHKKISEWRRKYDKMK